MIRGALEIAGYVFIAGSILGWMDLLWIFGVEDSARFTWWALIAK